MEVACSNEMLVMIYQTTWCYIPEGSKIHVEILFVVVLTDLCQPGLAPFTLQTEVTIDVDFKSLHPMVLPYAPSEVPHQKEKTGNSFLFGLYLTSSDSIFSFPNLPICCLET
jgi:hypothetical protein